MVMQILPRETADFPPQLRPMDPGRDMGDIAHVIEVAFSNELSPGGHLIMQDLRFLNMLGPLVWIVTRAMPALRHLFGGYVWEEGGRVVANTTLTSLDNRGEQWVISNVAVLPDYRRQGIGRALMQAAVDDARAQGGRYVMLQVRHDNKGAKTLYESLGFRYLETLTEMVSTSVRYIKLPYGSNVEIKRPHSQRWYEAYEVARAAIPPAVQHIRPLRAHSFRIPPRSLFGWLRDAMFGAARERWWAEVNGEIRGLLTIDRQFSHHGERLDVLIPPKGVGQVEAALVSQIAQRLRGHRQTRASIPAHLEQMRTLMCKAGFREVRSLDQMALRLN